MMVFTKEMNFSGIDLMGRIDWFVLVPLVEVEMMTCHLLQMLLFFFFSIDIPSSLDYHLDQWKYIDFSFFFMLHSLDMNCVSSTMDSDIKLILLAFWVALLEDLLEESIHQKKRKKESRRVIHLTQPPEEQTAAYSWTTFIFLSWLQALPFSWVKMKHSPASVICSALSAI